MGEFVPPRLGTMAGGVGYLKGATAADLVDPHSEDPSARGRFGDIREKARRAYLVRQKGDIMAAELTSDLTTGNCPWHHGGRRSEGWLRKLRGPSFLPNHEVACATSTPRSVLARGLAQGPDGTWDT